MVTLEKLIEIVRIQMPTLLETEVREWAQILYPAMVQAEQEMHEIWDYENDRYKA